VDTFLGEGIVVGIEAKPRLLPRCKRKAWKIGRSAFSVVMAIGPRPPRYWFSPPSKRSSFLK
jgi:hypothetical protein